jgi:hypothetical protein
MDIPKTYFKQSQKYLNSSLIALIPAVLFSVVFLLQFYEKRLLVFVIPFLLYSFYLFQWYVINKNRSMTATNLLENSLIKNEINKTFMDYNQFVLFFAKEEKELLFFQPSGDILAKMIFKKAKKSHPREIQLIDYRNNLLASYYCGYHQVDVYIPGRGYIGSFYLEENNLNEGYFQVLSGKTIGTWKSNKWYLDDQIHDNQQQIISRTQKGWMPVQLQGLFLNPNAPILTIIPTVKEEDQFLYFASTVKRYFHM